MSRISAMHVVFKKKLPNLSQLLMLSAATTGEQWISAFRILYECLSSPNSKHAKVLLEI